VFNGHIPCYAERNKEQQKKHAQFQMSHTFHGVI
jgi:hypothetical protein